MHIWIGVENFAKIERAKICTNNYTVLVGPNNSGKTFLMQLVQGINKKISYMLDETIFDSLLMNKGETYKEYVLNCQNAEKLTEYINAKLALEKENIVKEIFGKEIPIGRLYIDILMEETVYNIALIDIEKEESAEHIEWYEKLNPVTVDFIHKLNKGIVCIVSKKDTEQTVLKPISISGSIVKDEMRLLKNSFCSIIEPESLFLPASRTGLLLLYREFFANKTDRELSFTVEENQIVENQKNFASLTQPIYEFLRFLQTYIQKDVRIKRFQKELDFFEEHIIEGRINVDKQGIFSYSSKDKKDKVPMYLASSMINEVAPLILAITSQNAYGRLIIDEVEASLHPQKQLELVRFFNRLNNNGMQLMISTHSDTFVSKLNNLYVLSEIAKINGEDIVRRFGMEKEDLVSPEKLFVYEFINQPNGKSVAKEIKPDKKTGYQFDLFTESALRLYEEAEQLGEMQ